VREVIDQRGWCPRPVARDRMQVQIDRVVRANSQATVSIRSKTRIHESNVLLIEKSTNLSAVRKGTQV